MQREMEHMDRIRVFISHASPEADDADRLVSYLEGHGIPCWIAPRDIPEGKEFAEALLDGIEACDLMVVLLTDAANRSQHVLREINHAVDQRKPILPVLVGSINLSRSIRYYISHTQWLKLADGVPLTDCFEGIEKALSRPPARRRSRGEPPQPVIVHPRSRRAGVVGGLAAAVALVAGAWYALFPGGVRFTAQQENALKEVLGYTGMHMAALNGIFTEMRTLYTESGYYLDGRRGAGDWANLAQRLDHSKKQIASLAATPRELPGWVAPALSATKFSVPDAAALHSLAQMQADDCQQTIEMLRFHFKPESPMKTPQQRELIRIYSAMLEENAKTVYFGVCELLSPVAGLAPVREFRSEAVRDWSFFDAAYAAQWDASPETLRNAQNQAYEKLKTLVTDLATVTGRMQDDLNDAEALVGNRNLLIEQVTADWSRLDAYAGTLSGAVAPDRLDAIAALWNGTATVSPELRAGQHQALCKMLNDQVSGAAEKNLGGALFTDTLLGLCSKGSIPAESVRPIYEMIDHVREKHANLESAIVKLNGAGTRPEVDAALDDVRAYAGKALAWAAQAHVDALKFVAWLPEPLQEKPRRVLSGFQTLRPTALPSADDMIRLEQETASRIGETVAQSTRKVEEMQAQLAEKQQQLEEARNRVREKFRVAPDDEPGLVIGKALRLREVGLTDDAVAAFEQYGKMFGNMGRDAGEHLQPDTVAAYVKAAIALTRGLADFGATGGAFVFGFQDCRDTPPFQKHDVMIKINGENVKDNDSFIDARKASKETGKDMTVTVLRVGADGKPETAQVLYAADCACAVGVMSI